MLAVWIVVGVVVLAVLWAVYSYNRLVRLRVNVDNAWSQIDVQLRRRYDLIPNLIESVKGYAAHEREVFEDVTQARAAARDASGVRDQADAENAVSKSLGRLLAVAENYPDLKANQNFLALQSELSNTEDRLQTARRFYNSNVRDYNRRVQSFPSNLVASSFGFKEEQFFEVDEALRGEGGVPHVDFVGEAPGVTFGEQPGAPEPAPAQSEPGDAPPPPPAPPS